MNKLCLVVSGESGFMLGRIFDEMGINFTSGFVIKRPDAPGSMRQMIKSRLKIAFEKAKEPVINLDFGFRVPFLKKDEWYWALVVSLRGASGILNAAKNAKGRQRRCEYVHCLGYYDGNGEPEFFEHCFSGRLALSARGREFSCQTDLVFIPEGFDKTVGQMGQAEYEDWVRGLGKIAPLRKFANWWQQR